MKCPKCKNELKKVKAGYVCSKCGARFKASKPTAKPHPVQTAKRTAKPAVAAKPVVAKQATEDDIETQPFKNTIVTGGAFAIVLAAMTLLTIFGLKSGNRESVVMAAEMDSPDEEQAEEATEETALQKNIREWEEQEPEKKPEYTDGRIHSLDDISDETVDAMVRFTTSDLKERVASKEDALELFGELLDTKHKNMFPEEDRDDKHPYSYWVSFAPENGMSEGDLSFGDPIAIDTFLVKDKENEDNGKLYIIYELEADAVFSYTMMPGSANSMTDKVYISYSYDLDLSDADMPLQDFNNYEFGGTQGADIDRKSWELQNIKKQRDTYELVEESVPARG